MTEQSVHLGNYGQSIFKGWLDRNGIIPQPPENDQLGWDFLVEFQAVNQQGIPLDQQGDLKKAFIQIKSTRDRANSVPGKLSAFKALADTDLPTFIAWPAPGSEDTEFGVLMEPEVDHGKAEVYARVQA